MPNRGDSTSFDLSYYFGFDLFLHILSMLDVKSLGKCIAVSKEWRSVAVSDVLWEKQKSELWEGKIYVDPKALRPGLRPVEAFAISILESRRTRLTEEEICSFSWTVRFRLTAPSYWLSLDPYYNGLPPMQRFFHPDGYVSSGPKDPVWGGHECSWKLVNEGNVQVNSWPILQTERTPNWGWTMQNFWIIYSASNYFPADSPPESQGCLLSDTSICHHPRNHNE